MLAAIPVKIPGIKQNKGHKKTLIISGTNILLIDINNIPDKNKRNGLIKPKKRPNKKVKNILFLNKKNILLKILLYFNKKPSKKTELFLE